MIALIAAFLVAAFFLYGCHRFLLDKRYKLPPGPLALPFLGNFYLVDPAGKSWVVFRDLARKFGSIFTFYFGHYRVVVLNSPDVIHEALVEQSKVVNGRPIVLPGFDQLKRNGILMSDGPTWQANRRFTMKAMRDFGMGKLAIVDKLHDEIEHLLADIEAKKGQAFEPHKLVTNAISNIICSIIFGKRFSYGDPDFIRLADIFDRVISRQFSRSGHYFLFPFLRYFFTHPMVSDFAELEEFVGKLERECIAEHRRDYDPENIRDFPDLFIQSELSSQGIDFEAFTQTMIDMFGAGTETTTTSINWTLLYLCKYPDVMKRCQQEIDNAIETNRLPTLADRPQLAYIDAVMCEILRHCTIAPLSLLHANVDGEVKIKGYEVPKGTVICYNIWALHHEETYWKNPGEFDPNRWLDADGKLLTHSSYFMPFGAGPRICLGESLARMEYFVFVVSILKRFWFSLVDKTVSLDAGINGLSHAPPSFRLIATKRND